jgi:DNA-binding SARP family transcriptional activator
MVGLRTFGGFDVDLDGALGRAARLRPRIKALLALLIGYGPRGLSRDKILAYLWPESDTDHARNSLKQALFSLRHAFSGPIVFWPPGLLRLNPQLVEVDRWSFESALANGQEQAAVSFYRGPFLDGFYVSGLAEFERWAELERGRLAAAHADALKILATRAEAAADWGAAVAWWRRLTEAEPFSTSAVLGLMRALESAGDPTAAVEHARRHVARVREELDCQVADEVVSFVRRLVTRRPPVTLRSDRVELPAAPASGPSSAARVASVVVSPHAGDDKILLPVKDKLVQRQVKRRTQRLVSS